MKLKKTFMLCCALGLAAGPLLGVTWGAFNPSNHTITATEGGRTLTFTLPRPAAGEGQYLGLTNGRHHFEQAGNIYRLELAIDGPSLHVTIDMDPMVPQSPWGTIEGIRAEVSGTWRRVDLSQYGIAKGHDFNQKATYVDAADLWMWGFWKPEVSQGTQWKLQQATYNNNGGSGPVDLMSDMLYHPDSGGQREPLFEKLEVRVGEDLWDAVPTFPPSRVSAWAQPLAETVFVDSWSHDNAAELAHLVSTLQQIAGEGTRFYVNWSTWGAGGHDSFLPDSLWLGHDPPFPPNHAGFGSLASMRALADVSKAAGWMSFRTFYSLFDEEGPSYQQGLVQPVQIRNGSGGFKPGTFTKRGLLSEIYERQEPEVKSHLGSSAIFTDTLSTGYPFSYADYDGGVASGLQMATQTQHDRTMANFLASEHGGPVFGEGLANETLLGTWVDGGEFDLHNGFGRLMTPEYKLRRLHGLSTFHGLGLNYRFTDISQRWSASEYNRNGWRDPSLLDHYRAVQLLFGNGGFVYLENQLEDAPWHHYLSEVLMVAPLQQHFALEPISTIEYLVGNQWLTLEELVEDHQFEMISNNGRDVNPPYAAKPQSPEFERIRVTYANGLILVVNRGTADYGVSTPTQGVTVPPGGWAMWKGTSLLAYSAYAPGTNQRIDFMEDQVAGLRYVDPRGGSHFGVERPTQWVQKDGSWRVRLEADLDRPLPSVTLEGRRLPLRPARRAAATTLDHDFTSGFGGWRTILGPRVAEITADGLEMDLEAKFPFLHSPRLALPGAAGDVLEVDLRFDSPASGPARISVLFQRETDVAFWSSRIVTIDTTITGGWQTLSIPVGTHALWSGQTIKRLRLDPAKADMPAPPVELTLGAVRLVSGGAP